MITFLFSVTCLLLSVFLHFKKIHNTKNNKVSKYDINFYCDILFLAGLVLFFIGMTNMYAIYLNSIGFIYF